MCMHGTRISPLPISLSASLHVQVQLDALVSLTICCCYAPNWLFGQFMLKMGFPLNTCKSQGPLLESLIQVLSRSAAL